MSHLRTQARAAVGALIVAAATNAGTRVYIGRVYPLADAGPWPQVTVTTSPHGEDISVASMGGIGQRRYERKYHIDIGIHAKDPSDPETIVDDCALQIEKAMANAITLSGACKFHGLIATRTDLADADLPAALHVLTYEVLFISAEGTPDILA